MDTYPFWVIYNRIMIIVNCFLTYKYEDEDEDEDEMRHPDPRSKEIPILFFVFSNLFFHVNAYLSECFKV